MIIWGVVTWWYTDGWRQSLLNNKERIEATLDYFSIDLLAKTLFSPYRQIAAAQVRGSFDVQMRAFFDRLISRFIGMAVRLVIIIIGSLAVLFNVLVGGALLVVWALVPTLPVIGFGLFLLGWLPWSN